MEIANLAPAAS